MPTSESQLDEMVEEIFTVFKVIAAARSRRPSGSADLPEAEFLTLDVLSKDGPLTIGEVQKRIGVVPAQMSRIVRSLETEGGRGYVECRINAKDRRRIDISLTDAGEKAHSAFRNARMGSFYTVLEALDPDDRVEFMRMLRQIQEAFQREAAPK